MFVLAAVARARRLGWRARERRTGEVIGVAFAIDPGRDGTSYALTDDEVRAVLDTVDFQGADTGRCLVG